MIVTAQRAFEKITKGTIAPGYLLLGRDIYWRDRIWFGLRRAMGLEQSPTGVSEADLRQSSLDAILAQAAERNLWTSRQIILVRNAHSISGAKPLESLAGYFRAANPDTVLVFEMSDVEIGADDWREKDKLKSRQENWEKLCEVVLLAPASVADSLELVRREAAERGAEISPQAAELLVALLDRDLGRIVKELDKLCLYRQTNEGISEAISESISESDVELLAGNRVAAHGLSLPQAIGTGDPKQILEAFEELIPRGAYMPLVISDITRYLRQLILLQESRVRDPREASKILWSARLPAPQPLVPELMRQARSMPLNHLVRCFQKALGVELALRSSPVDDRLIVERLLVELARPLRLKNAGRPPAAVARS